MQQLTTKASTKRRLQPKQAKAAAMLASGKTMEETGKALGYHKSTISRMASKPEIKALIDKANNELTTNALSNIIERVVMEQQAALDLTKTIVKGEANKTTIDDFKDQNEFLKRSDKTGVEIMKSLSVLASHTQSLMIQNIYNDNRKTVLSPVLSNLLSDRLSSLDDIEDAEVIDG